MSFSPISAGPFVLTQVANAVNPPGTTIYTGTITGGGANAFIGYTFTVTGFTLTNGSNNGQNLLCVASSGTTLTLVNPNGTAETGPAVANGARVTLQYGPQVPAATFINPNLGGQPPASNLLVPPDSPKGPSLVPRNYVNGFNYVNTITSTKEMLVNVLKVESAQQGSAALNAPVVCNGGISAAAQQSYRWQ